MALTEKKILEKEEIKRKNAESYEIFFDEWINQIDIKYFDLNKTKAETFFDFYNTILETEKYSKLIMKIFKSYYLKDKASMKPHYDAASLYIFTTSHNSILKKFVEENIHTTHEHKCENYGDVLATITDAVITNMEDVFGDIFMLNLPNLFIEQRGDVCKAVKTDLQKRGFSNFGFKWTLIVRPDSKKEVVVKEEHQKFLLDGYKKMSMKFCTNSYVAFSKELKERKFIQLYGIVKKYLENVEARLTETSKTNPEFIKLKAQNEKFFDTMLIPYINDLSVEKDSDNYYERVSRAVDMYTKKKASSADEEVLKRFHNRLNVLEKALTILDEDGECYASNYFVVMPMDPILLYGLLPRFQKCGFLNKEETTKLLEVKRSMHALFSRSPQLNGKIYNLEKFLSGYKGTFMKNGRTIVIDDDNFPQFMQKIRDVIEEYNLPLTHPCVNSIAYRLSRGCKKVVDVENLKLQKLETERII